MFIIRRAKSDDVQTLLKLAKMVHFLNLPADREIIEDKVNWSRQCFLMAGEVGASMKPAESKKPRKGKPTANGSNGTHARDPGVLAAGMKGITGRSPVFVFVMQELDDSRDENILSAATSANSAVLGTSQIISQISGPGQPNLSLELRKVEKFSQALQVGVSHMMAKLHLDEEGPTEIGGLILQPSYRGHREKLGRLLSLVRFHFMGLHRELFADRVLAEMMGPVTIDGQSPFWDGFTRRFINMSYEEADRFCQEGKEFILSLFPREELYLTLLPPEARACVAQVGDDTIPARKLLERLGFTYHNRIDPFDGGPHLECATDDISLVKATECRRLASPVESDAALREFGMVSVNDEDGEFRAAQCRFGFDRAGKIILPRRVMRALAAEPGMSAGHTALESRPADAASAGAKKKKRAARRV